MNGEHGATVAHDFDLVPDTDHCRTCGHGRLADVHSCPGCEHENGHQYDDDHPFDNDWTREYFQSIGSGSRVGDPCVWCDHEKCAACPAPGGTA